MRPRALVASLVVSSFALAEAADSKTAGVVKKTPQIRGIRARYKLVSIEEGDLDGDGSREVVAAFKPRREGRKRGGFIIVQQRGGKYRTIWAAIFPHSYPESLSVEKDTLRAQMVTPSGKNAIALRYAKHFRFFQDKESPFKAVKATVSSTLKAPRGTPIDPKNLLDGDPDTVWAEGAIGTGAGEWIELEFPRPSPLGLIGLIGGDFRSPKHWMDSNRLHRFTVTVETEADRKTTVEDIDLTRELRLPSTGKRVTAKTKDIRRTKWVEIAHRDIVAARMEVSSVYLGDKNDDLFVTEIDFAELLPDPTGRETDLVEESSGGPSTPVRPGQTP